MYHPTRTRAGRRTRTRTRTCTCTPRLLPRRPRHRRPTHPLTRLRIPIRITAKPLLIPRRTNHLLHPLLQTLPHLLPRRALPLPNPTLHHTNPRLTLPFLTKRIPRRLNSVARTACVHVPKSVWVHLLRVADHAPGLQACRAFEAWVLGCGCACGAGAGGREPGRVRVGCGVRGGRAGGSVGVGCECEGVGGGWGGG